MLRKPLHVRVTTSQASLQRFDRGGYPRFPNLPIRPAISKRGPGGYAGNLPNTQIHTPYSVSVLPPQPIYHKLPEGGESQCRKATPEGYNETGGYYNATNSDEFGGYCSYKWNGDSYAGNDMNRWNRWNGNEWSANGIGSAADAGPSDGGGDVGGSGWAGDGGGDSGGSGWAGEGG
ncbi:hypothetical protein GYMLUDRAFT_49076, partial [Collybiopsis luxurians FD-317 M1]